MLQEGKQLEEKFNLYNTKRVEINNHKTGNGLNEAFIRDN